MHWFDAFLLMPLPNQNSLPSYCHHVLGRRKLLILSKICFLQQQKWVEETMICFIKIQSENMKMTWNIRFFMFCMICNYFKCDDFTVLWVISIIQCGVLLLLLCNHDNMILKLHQRKVATWMKGGLLLVVSKLEVYQEWKIKKC